MNDKKIIYTPKYVSDEELKEIRHFYNVKINDSIYDSAGPKISEKNALGWYGCWDRSLHIEISDNPVHKLIARLKNNFGDFVVEPCNASIRYLSSPFLPHTDVISNEWISNLKKNKIKEGWIFIIPLSIKENYVGGTAFFNSPPNLHEPLYSEMLDVLPKYAENYQEEMRNFSVKQIVKWNSPGDLIAWENFQWHSSCHFNDPVYRKDTWLKEFICIKTYRK